MKVVLTTRFLNYIWSDNLQFPYTSKLEVYMRSDNFLMYNLQLPYKFDSHQFIMVDMVIMVELVKMVEMVKMVVMAMVIRLSMLIIVTKVTMVETVSMVTRAQNL